MDWLDNLFTKCGLTEKIKKPVTCIDCNSIETMWCVNGYLYCSEHYFKRMNSAVENDAKLQGENK